MASAFAANTGCAIGTCTVEKSAMLRVTPARPAAKVKVSKDHSRLFTSPPKPFQRAIGKMNSMPACIRHLRDRDDVGPEREPALGHAGERQPAIGVEGENAELEGVRAVHRVHGGTHRSSYRPDECDGRNDLAQG